MKLDPYKSGNGAGWKWALLMSWRDSRRNRIKLILFVLSIVLGLSALIAIRGFGRMWKKLLTNSPRACWGPI